MFRARAFLLLTVLAVLAVGRVQAQDESVTKPVTAAAGERAFDADTTPPSIANIQVLELQPKLAIIAFDANETCTGRVWFGRACGGEDWISVDDSSFDTSHIAFLSTLIPLTTYYYVVEATDAAGNGATDDNGGICHTFTTPEQPDCFTEWFSAYDNDLSNGTLSFTPNGSMSFYQACHETTTAFPTDPSGGVVLTMGDDSSTRVQIADGKQVWLYGTPYTAFFVGANGYVTFTAGDQTWSESYSRHFAQPRISALFDDLEGASGGAISWKQLPDRVAVTFSGMREPGALEPNYFQIEMLFNGGITITHLAIAARDGLVGLSNGTGVPMGMVESNLSSYSSCDALGVSPDAAFAVTEHTDGLFTPCSRVYTLANGGGSALDWMASASQPWLEVTPANGSLDPGGTAEVTVSVNADASALTPGTYLDTLLFTNATSGYVLRRAVNLEVLPVPGRIAVTDTLAPITDATLAFGDVILGLARTEQVTVSNTDTIHTLIVTDVRLNTEAAKTPENSELPGYASLSGGMSSLGGGGVASVFQLANVPVLPYTVVPGSSFTFDVTYRPVEVEPNTASLFIDSNDSGVKTVGVALAGDGIPDSLTIATLGAFRPVGHVGGPFTPSSMTYVLANAGTGPLAWTASGTEAWLNVAPASGSLNPGDTVDVTVSLTANANALEPATYPDTLSFTNVTSGLIQRRTARLAVIAVRWPCNPSPEDDASGEPVYTHLYWSMCADGRVNLVGTWQFTNTWGKGDGEWYLVDDGTFTGSGGVRGTWQVAGGAFTLAGNSGVTYYGTVKSATAMDGYMECGGLSGTWSASKISKADSDGPDSTATGNVGAAKPSGISKTSANVAIFEDLSTTIAGICASNGMSYAVYGSADMGVVDLLPFDKVIVSSWQEDPFYAALAANRAWFENYVDGGGVLELHCGTFFVSTLEEMVFPGGFVVGPDPSDLVTIVDPTHPIVTTPYAISDDDVDNWYPSTTSSFATLPIGAQEIARTSGNNLPCCAELALGSGRIIATTQTVEWTPSSHDFLENMILYRSGTSGIHYDVYMDTFSPPTTLISSVSSTTVDPGTLVPGVRYFWNVVAHTDLGDEPGPVWSFTTTEMTSPDMRVVVPESLDVVVYSGSTHLANPGIIIGNVGGGALHFQIKVQYDMETGKQEANLDGIRKEVDASIRRSGILDGPIVVGSTSTARMGRASLGGGAAVITEPSSVASVVTAAEAGIVTASSVNVAVYGAENNEGWLEDIQTKLLKTGVFGSVSIFNVATFTPNLFGLLSYDAVMVFSNADYSDAATLGNVMADYAATGGGVVCCMFDMGDTLGTGSMQGRWATDGYALMDRSDFVKGPASLGVVHEPAHPIMNGVSRFNGGSVAPRPVATGVYPGVHLIAEWSDGHPLVAAANINGSNRADICFFPVSGDMTQGSWISSTDGAQLMANALSWAANPPTWLSVQTPLGATLAIGGSREKWVQFTAYGLAAGVYAGNIKIQSDDPAKPTVYVPCRMTVVDAITIDVAPVGGTRCLGGSMNFSVAASGGQPPLSYQWRKNGEDIPGAKAPMYSLYDLQQGDAGSYTVVICDANAQCIESGAAELQVNPACVPIVGVATLMVAAGVCALASTALRRRMR